MLKDSRFFFQSADGEISLYQFAFKDGRKSPLIPFIKAGMGDFKGKLVLMVTSL
jgi:hypothetical protein